LPALASLPLHAYFWDEFWGEGQIELLSQALPATYIAFDVLFRNGKERLEVPLGERKQLLQRILRDSPYLVESRYILEKGKTFFHEAVAAGLEGFMAEAVASP
jgi:ATP-dependent DNA ligase